MQDKGKGLGEKSVVGRSELCGSQISDGGTEGVNDYALWIGGRFDGHRR